VSLCHLQKGVLEELFQTATCTAMDEVAELPTGSYCAMCECFLYSTNPGVRHGATGSELIYCNTCEELVRKGEYVRGRGRLNNASHRICCVAVQGLRIVCIGIMIYSLASRVTIVSIKVCCVLSVCRTVTAALPERFHGAVSLAGRELRLSNREMHSLHQAGTIREVLGLDHESSAEPKENDDVTASLNQPEALPEAESAEGIARIGQLLASGKVRS
jgi:hypothetical protein